MGGKRSGRDRIEMRKRWSKKVRRKVGGKEMLGRSEKREWWYLPFVS